MTLATKITVFRILLIPVFVGLAIYYGQSVKLGAPLEIYRWSAIVAFTVAAASDAVDGFIARRFNQRSRLGTILDPIADKGLMTAAVITLSFTNWGQYFPIWYAALVIGRDAVLVCGALLMNQVIDHVHIQPHWTGKAATATQILAVGVLMFQLPPPSLTVTTVLAACFTAISAALYIREGLRQVHDDGHD